MTLSISPADALIIVDIQNDFLSGGALAVAGGDEVIEGVNRLMERFARHHARIVLTQDWHPRDHLSFASQHRCKKPFDGIEGVFGIGPVLWPDHCVAGTMGARFHSRLNVDLAHLIIRKGIHQTIDSYSAFLENDGQTETGLAGYLECTRLNRIYLCGLALDYCVFWSAMDAKRKGFETFVIPELCRSISPETAANAQDKMLAARIRFLATRDFT